MKKVLLQILIFLALPVQAGGLIANETYSAGELALVKVSVKDVGEPVYEPLVLTISVLCKDNRLSKTSAAPRWIIAKDDSICAWGGQRFDSEKNQIIFRADKAEMIVGDAPCTAQKPRALDLKKICAPWNN